MNHHTLQSGFSLVEVLVAISILLIATVGPMTIAARSLQYAEFSAQQNTAYFLAQEGIEAVAKVRADAGLASLSSPADSWAWTSGGQFGPPRQCFNTSNGCGIDWQSVSNFVQVNNCTAAVGCSIYFDETNTGSSRFVHGGTPDQETAYSRVITIEEFGSSGINQRVRVNSTVTWNMHPSGQPQRVTLETYLHDIYDFTP